MSTGVPQQFLRDQILAALRNAGRPLSTAMIANAVLPAQRETVVVGSDADVVVGRTRIGGDPVVAFVGSTAGGQLIYQVSKPAPAALMFPHLQALELVGRISRVGQDRQLFWIYRETLGAGEVFAQLEALYRRDAVEPGR